jgi:hypothetical protein
MRKKTTKDYEKILKGELDRGNNFVDYFTVIGLPSDLIFSDFLYENDLYKIHESGKLKPEILSKFPPFDKSTISIDENIIKVRYQLVIVALLPKRVLFKRNAFTASN